MKPTNQQPPTWLWLAVVGGCYLLGVSFGAIAALVHPEIGAEVAQGTGHTPGVAEIFGQNIRVMVLLWLGAITAGLATLGILMFNGVVLGVTMTIIIQLGQGRSLLTGILPHAIPEISAFIISGSATCWLALRIMHSVVRRGQISTSDFRRGWVYPQIFSAVLLFIGALIEGNISHA